MISIIIPVVNQHEMTTECVNRVRVCTAGDFEFVIIDNGSEPAYKPPFTGFNETKLIRNEENRGFPAAVNQGIAAAAGDTIVLLNNDVIVTPGALNLLEAWLENGFDIVGPLTNFAAGLQRIKLPDYNNDDELNKEANYLSQENAGEFYKVNFIIGFCMVFKKETAEKMGPFDESLWPCSGEEIDFCFRAREAGLSIGIATDVYVHHFGSLTFNDMEEAGKLDYNEIVERNDKHLAEKWGDDFWHRQAEISKDDGVRINIGSGPFPLPGFINIDQFENVKPDLVADALNLPFQSETVSEIYAGHILEHFMADDGRKALRYWHSLLKRGGTISISVPDFDHLCRKYLSNPSPERLIEFNDLYIYSGVQPSPHQYAYSAALLKKVMEDAGFKNLKVMPMNHPYYPHKVDWQIGYTGVKA